MNTIAARIIYQIYTRNEIVASLTFHGGTNVIGYPWGSYNRSYKRGQNVYQGYKAPDHNSFQAFGEIMQKKAGSIISSKDPKFSTREYILGDMSSTVYPVGGGLEDWSYGASWD
jgi:hypothetical protein